MAARYAQVTFASFRNPGTDGAGSGGWRIGPTVHPTREEATFVAAHAPTQLRPTEDFDDFISQEAIDALPRRFEYIPPALGPGGAAVYLQSLPAGADATGRPGNVFTHAYIDRTPQAAGPVRYPSDAYLGPGFVTPFRKAAVNSVALNPTGQPEPRPSGADDPFDVAWLVVSQLLGDRTGALASLQDALQQAADPATGTVAALIVQNNTDTTYWLNALFSTMAPAAAATVRFSTFERARDINVARLKKQHTRLVCVPAADRAELATVQGLTIIDPSDSRTFAQATSPWAQLTHSLLCDAAAPAAHTVVEHLASISHLPGAEILPAGLALAVAAHPGAYPAQARALAMSALKQLGVAAPAPASSSRRAATGAAAGAAPGAHAAVSHGQGGLPAAWAELAADPLHAVVPEGAGTAAASAYSLRHEDDSVHATARGILTDLVASADVRSDIRGRARAEFVATLLRITAASGLIDHGAPGAIVDAFHDSAAFAAHLGGDQNLPAEVDENLAGLVHAAWTRRHTTAGGWAHPDWALRAGTTISPHAAAAYHFTTATGLPRAEATASRLLTGHNAPGSDIEELLRLLVQAEVTAIDTGARPPGAHAHDSVTDIISVLKQRGHGSLVAASRIEEVRRSRRLIALIHPARDLVDVIGHLRSGAGKDIADMARSIHPDVARTATFTAAVVRLWVVLVPYARAYPLLNHQASPDDIARLAESAAIFDTNISGDPLQRLYTQWIQPDLMAPTGDEEVLSAAGGWLRYSAAGLPDTTAGRVLAGLVALAARDPHMPSAFAAAVTGAERE